MNKELQIRNSTVAFLVFTLDAGEDGIEVRVQNGDVKYFTFEPHISFPDSKYGYKKENIYYFNENGLMEP